MLSDQEKNIIYKWVIENRWIDDYTYASSGININPPQLNNNLRCPHNKCKGHYYSFVRTGKLELTISLSWKICCKLWKQKIIVNYQSTCSVCGISKWDSRNEYLYFCSCCQQVFIC